MREVQRELRAFVRACWSGPEWMFKDLYRQVARQYEQVLHEVEINRRAPADVALSYLGNYTRQQLLFGDSFVYRGVLSGTGRSFRQCLAKTYEEECAHGYRASVDAEALLAEVDEACRTLG